jgi:hypothetical protein
MLRIAFKEWAAVCRALAEGRQSLIIRKGGIAEDGGVFKPEYTRFWLYPTYLHQQDQGIKPADLGYLRLALTDRPPQGFLRISLFAEIAEIYFVSSINAALVLDDLHIWSLDTIRQRFHYRTPGLYVLLIRVYRCPTIDVVEHPAYAGCKTWVELDRELSTGGATPVLSDDGFVTEQAAIRRRLQEQTE